MSPRPAPARPLPAELYTVAEVAQTCRAPIRTVRYWLQTQQLKSLRLGLPEVLRG